MRWRVGKTDCESVEMKFVLCILLSGTEVMEQLISATGQVYILNF